MANPATSPPLSASFEFEGAEPVFQLRLMEGVAESAIDGILVVSEGGRILYFNRRFIDLWDIPDGVLDSRRDADALAAVQQHLLDPQEFLDRLTYLYEHPLEKSQDQVLLRDGRTFDGYSAPVVDDEGGPRSRVWFFRDVTDGRQAARASEILADAGELFGSSLDFEMILSHLAHLIVPRMGDWAAVDVVDEAGVFRRLGAAHVVPGGEELLVELDRRFPLRARDGRLRGMVVATGKPVALYEVGERDLKAIARDTEHLELLRRLGVRSALWVPLIARDRVLGVISAGYRDDRRRYTPADLALLEELARRAALAVDNALLYQIVGRGERRQAALSALGERALAGGLVPELLQAAAELLATMVEVPYAEVLELAADGQRLRLVAGMGWDEGLVGRATVDAGLGSQGGFTLATIGPVTVTDLPTETRFRPPKLLVRHDVVSGLTVVIGGPQRPYGVLGVHSRITRQFADDDVNFLQTVANVLAAAIQRQASEDQLSLLASSERSRAAELKAVIESIGDAVIVCDSAGRVLLANPSAEALLGGRLDDGLGVILPAFSWPDSAVRRPPAGESIELRMPANADDRVTAEVEDRWFELSSYPVVEGDDVAESLDGTVLVFRDVTAARNARAVREAFVSILSHELRTPVTTIYGGSEMLARAGRTISEETRREVYDDIRAEADRLYRLVENLLVLSRVERQGLQIDSEPVLLQRMLPRVVEGELARWPLVRFELDLPAGLPPVAAEETYLEQIVRNLLANAAKYGGEGQVRVSATVPDGMVRVTVADEGPGFEESELSRLFEIFYRSPSASRRASGAGIGLFVTKQLVEAMGGRMWAANRPTGGAEFSVEVPIFETADF